MDKPSIFNAIDQAISSGNTPAGAIATETELDKARRYLAGEEGCCPTSMRTLLYRGVRISRAMVPLTAEYQIWGAK